MREIKFRAWDKELGKFHFPELWDSSMPSNWKAYYDLQQYTGLKDKNGKEIYEGDILQFFHFTDSGRNKHFIKHAVEWSDKFSGWFLKNVRAKTENDGCVQAFVVIKNENPEIIGNIYENPELLEA